MPRSKIIVSTFPSTFATLLFGVAVSCLACVGCTNNTNNQPPASTKPEKVAEFKFSHEELKGDAPYRAATNLTAGKEAWVSIEMTDGTSWAASTPTGPNVEFWVVGQWRMKVSGGRGLPQEAGRVEAGYLREMSPGGYLHSFTHKNVVAFGTMARCFETSHIELRFIPIESGQYNIEFEHKRQPEQGGFQKYNILVHQMK